MKKEWMNHEEMIEFLKEKIKPDLKKKIKEEEFLAAEYFRPKFEEIIDVMIGLDGLNMQQARELLDELIECLKNPEGK